MSPNMTSRKLLPIFTSYFWPAVLAFFMAIFLSQWAVADPPVSSDTPAAIAAEEAPPATPEDAIELPAPVESAPESTQLQTTPAVNVTPMAETKLSEKCYEQTDGSFECVCEGDEECKILETADHWLGRPAR